MKRWSSIALAAASVTTLSLSCRPGNIYLVDPPGSDSPDARRSGGRDARAGRDLGPADPDGGTIDEEEDSGATSPGDSGSTSPGRDTGPSNPGRDGGTPPPPPPPPPSGAPYDHATEAASDLRRALDITGHYGVALAGNHLLAGNASGSSTLPRETPLSSSGTIRIPAGATVRYALLYVAGVILQKPHNQGQGDYTPDLGGNLDQLSDVQGNGVSFSLGGMDYGPFDTLGRLAPNPSSLGSESQISPRTYAPSFGTLTGVKESVWGNRMDITGLFQGRTGDIAVTVDPPERLDINANDATRNGGNPAGNTQYNLCMGAASWSMLVIYEKADLEEKNLVLMDGAWARAWDYLFFHSGEWHRPKIRIDHAPIQHGAKFYVYAASSSPVGNTLPSNPACSCGCGGQYTLSRTPGPYGRNNFFSDTLVDPPAAAMDPIHRDRTNGPWYLQSTGQANPIAGNDWTLFQSGSVYTEFPNLYEGEEAPVADNIQPETNEDDTDASHDTYAGHPWGGRGVVTYHGHGNANSTVEVAVDNSRITVGEATSYIYFKGDQKDVWKPQQVVSAKYVLFETPTR